VTVRGWRKRGEPTSQRMDGEGAERMDVLGQRRRSTGRRCEPSAAVPIGVHVEEGMRGEERSAFVVYVPIDRAWVVRGVGEWVFGVNRYFFFTCSKRYLRADEVGLAHMRGRLGRQCEGGRTGKATISTILNG
jgi:hypothetical protein